MASSIACGSCIAGYGEEDGTTLLNRTDYSEAANWSHSSSVSPLYPVGEGVSAGPNIMMPENGGIGVFAHEYAHNLGRWTSILRQR